MAKKETAGKKALDLLMHSPTYLDHSPHEQMMEQLGEYDNNVFMCVEDGKKRYPGNFYVVVETKKEPKLNNVLRHYFFHRMSCPTPTYDNVVYRYHVLDEVIELLWVLPDKDTYFMMLDRSLEIDSDQRELLQFVLDDKDGTLLKTCMKLNQEIN